MTSKSSPMSSEFHEWLDECPVRWYRSAIDNDYVTYKFENEDTAERAVAAFEQLVAEEIEEIESEKRHNEGLRWPR